MASRSRPLALRLLWPSRGGVLPVERGRPIVIGRNPDADLVIPDDLVSRRHARLVHEGGGLIVEDLGSTNGTFVNGARVTRGPLVEGDRLLVGGSLLKVVAGDRPGPETAAPAAEKGASAMQGRIEDVPLRDLLQLVATARKTGLLAIQRPGREAELEVEQGCLVRCVLEGRSDLPRMKGLTRLLAWTKGNFELRRAAPSAAQGRPPAEPLEPLLAESMRQLQELRRLVPRLPRRFAVPPLPAEGVDEKDRALLALASECGSLQAILDATPLPDLEAAERLAVLLTRGLLEEGR